jgi:hypothetical protein
MAFRTHLIGGYFNDRLHDLDADARLMPMNRFMNYEDGAGAGGTQLPRAPGRAGAAGTGVPGRAPQPEAGS